MQVGFVNNQVSIVEGGGWLSQDQAYKLQQAIIAADTEHYCIFSFDSQDNLIMSIESMILADHLNKILAGRPVVLEFPITVNGMTPTKLALALICMGYGLNKVAALCLQQNK